MFNPKKNIITSILRHYKVFEDTTKDFTEAIFGNYIPKRNRNAVKELIYTEVPDVNETISSTKYLTAKTLKVNFSEVQKLSNYFYIENDIKINRNIIHK